MTALAIILVVLLLFGGLIAISGLIAMKKPNAAEIVQKLVPFQGLIGIALFTLGIVYFFVVGPGQLARMFRRNGFVGMIHVAMMLVPLLLGFYYSMLLVASLIPGRTLSENKAVALAEKLGIYSMLIGLLAIATALTYILQMTGILAKVMSL